jgi:RNA polymerase sigma factor (sigma-70 family)
LLFQSDSLPGLSPERPRAETALLPGFFPPPTLPRSNTGTKISIPDVGIVKGCVPLGRTMNESFVEQLRGFYETHRQELYTYSLALTRNREAAEDAIHTAFQRLLRRGSAPTDLRPYVFRCVRNAAIDDLRSKKRREDGIFDLPSNTDPAPALELGAELHQALGRLSEDERETIVLKVFDGLTLQEIADLRDASINTVASWYRRGMEKLKVLWMEEVK